MIASVRGRVSAVRLDCAVVELGGFGLLVQATPATLAGLRPGAEAELATSLIVREDSLTLFGFADADERDVFETVQTVSGIGPRLALAMLAVHTPDGLRAAVTAQDLTSLMKVPGIGRKGAQRIVLELTDRLGPPSGGDPGPVPIPLPAAGGAWRDQVVDALVGLGWTVRQAGEAVDAVAPDAGPAGDGEVPGVPGVPEVPEVAVVLRAALRRLGRAG